MARFCLALAAALGFSAAHAQEPVPKRPVVVSVRLASGRTFTGHVDPRSDDRQLWIRCTYGQAVVLRPVLWERIERAGIDGQTHTAVAFRELAEKLKRETPH